ncbi:hypothetical protein [Marinobacterium sediminicola]|uniref:DUF4149 domain-containing protein n=1 Tax=Marinobacterium sediminicola TaxID=518898 RepID=A0ABY1S3C6_9GAMM|nr:hypothetical protein [Marinobacterium sediminicola]ULG68826.1 hypothetical protein LN244_14180 [Marinobacterium sediminicola]SMR77569.1 hypothetical protein SAMN04487964_11460 [Marinobacterium sediminicola]
MKPTTLGWMGTLLLFVGVFTPIVSVPFMGNVNYFRNGEGDGVLVLILAGISAILLLKEKLRGLYLTAGLSLAVMLFSFFHFQSGMSEVRTEMEKDLAGNPFRGLADMAMESVQLQWGWAVLLVGVGLQLACAHSQNSK